MYLILDSNILIKDFYLKSQSTETIFSYLKTCGHKIILPKIVIDELIEKYKRNLEEYNEKVQKISESYKRLEIKDKLILVDVKKYVSEYSKFIESVIREKQIIIKDTDKNNYSKILDKAIKKLPPFKSVNGNDSGFKDAVIWEFVVDNLKENKYKPIAFITGNDRDFSNPSDKIRLNPSLQKEVEGLGLEYFISQEAFLEKYGMPLLGAVSKDNIFNSINNHLLKLTEKDIEDLFVYSTAPPIHSVDVDTLKLSLDNFYVYSADKDNYYVNGRITIKIFAAVYDLINDDLLGEDLSTGADVSLVVCKDKKLITVKDLNVDAPF